MAPQQLGELAAAATALLWTLSAVAWTLAGHRVGAVAVSFIRLPIACVYLAVYGGLVRGLWFPTDAEPSTWWLLGLSGLFGFFLSDLCLFKAFLLIGPRLGLLVQALIPPLTAILSWFWLGEEMLGRQWVAMAITASGVAWVVLERGNGQPTACPASARRFGLWLALFAAAAQAIGTVLCEPGIRTHHYDPFAATFIRVLGGMAGYLLAITLAGRWRWIASGVVHRRAMVIMTLGALVGPFLGVACYMIALDHTSAGVTLTIIGTTPVIILPFSIFLFREKVSLWAIGGVALAVAGIALLTL